ncbi:MAG: NAD(P)/FAD-dependent oxidoreductase, partial [Desulfobulbaceae bacterium]|nr:NAD(P)/FAD-dependent oxidoreductase [Desulfobulbaceae bacterium]
GIFVFIGTIPNNDILPKSLAMDKAGFLITDTEMITNIDGVYAAGDIRSKNFRQIINAAGEGATAELSAEHYLSGLI